MGERHRLLGDYRGGGDMRVGSLVMWVTKNADDCDLGVVSDIADKYITVHWCDGTTIEHIKDVVSNSLEVLCE